MDSQRDKARKYSFEFYPPKTAEGMAKLNAQLTELTAEQASYIGVAKTGPYKPEAYRY